MPRKPTTAKTKKPRRRDHVAERLIRKANNALAEATFGDFLDGLALGAIGAGLVLLNPEREFDPERMAKQLFAALRLHRPQHEPDAQNLLNGVKAGRNRLYSLFEAMGALQ